MSGLCIEGVSVEIGIRPLFNSISFALDKGECIVLRGPSGSGKSTLLRTIAGLRDATSGTIEFEERDGDEWGWPIWRRKVHLITNGFPFGRGNVQQALSRAFAMPSGPVEIEETELTLALQSLGLSQDVLHQDAISLSDGERQRLRLLRGLLIAPPVLLLDEPTNALDPATLTQTLDALTAYKDAGGAVLMVTHSPPNIESFSYKAIDLEQFQ